MKTIDNKDIKIAVVGLGYVGLPLACLFSNRYPTVGFDINAQRIDNLSSHIDQCHEVAPEVLRNALAGKLSITSNISDIQSCNVYIVAVPTPVDRHHNPDLHPLLSASNLVGKVLKKNDIVIYESTVYPGVTEDVCIPELEKVSALKYNVDFYGGYSPERINPGDKEHTVETIRKITSGSTPQVADFVDMLYASVLKNGTYKASSIRVAEAAKVIENAQRDVNIAFVNEIAKIFNAMGIDTHEVLNAAATKWNFINLKPGLVGGHCIGIDPYYLMQAAQVYGVSPHVITSARILNDSMGDYVANQVIRLMNKKGIVVKDAKILILGFTFKENCADIRNTRVIDIYSTLSTHTNNITIFDPVVSVDAVKKEYQIDIQIDNIESLQHSFDAVVLAVSHNQFLSLPVRDFLRTPDGVVYDVKGIYDPSIVDGRL